MKLARIPAKRARRGAAAVGLLGAAYPGLRSLRLDVDQPDRGSAELCARERVPFRALEPDARAATAAGQTLHWPFDGHWNAAGNAFAAERLAELAAPLLEARKPSSAP